MEKTNILADYIEFKRLRALCINKSKLCYKSYITNSESQPSKNIKAFCGFVKRKKSNSDIPNNMHYKNLKSDNGQDICN